MQLLAGLGPLGLPELGIILVIVILVFGVGRLPEVGGAVGKGIREFRKATKDDEPAVTMNSTATSSTEATAPEPMAPPVSAPSPDVLETVFCSECGARNARTAKFCAECGRAIGAPVS